MVPQKHFKFTVERSHGRGVICAIYATAPTLAVRYMLSPGLNEPDATRLMQLELKQEFIKAILEGEWEFKYVQG